MSTTPDGEFAKALYNLETLLANSAQFKTSVGAATADLARAAIYWMGMEPDVTTAHGWIRLTAGAGGSSPDSGGGGFWHTFPFSLVLFRPDASEVTLATTDTTTQRNTKHKERVIAFMTWLGTIIREMEALAKTAGYLHVTAFTVNSISFSDPNEASSYMMAVVEVSV